MPKLLPTRRRSAEGRGVKGEIVVAGLKISAEEWQALDEATRAELNAVMDEQSRPRLVIYVAGGTVVADDDVEVRRA